MSGEAAHKFLFDRLLYLYN